MKINPMLPGSFFRTKPSAAPAAGNVSAAPQAERAVKMDTISFSGPSPEQGVYGKLVRNIAGEVMTCEGSSRMEELRQAVTAGTYHVPTEELAGAILSHMVGE